MEKNTDFLHSILAKRMDLTKEQKKEIVKLIKEVLK